MILDIINFYDAGDCIPPHIDHHDFARPFVTLSLLSEQVMLLGSEIRVVGGGEFDAPVKLPLPIGKRRVWIGSGVVGSRYGYTAGWGHDRFSLTAQQVAIHIRLSSCTQLWMCLIHR